MTASSRNTRPHSLRWPETPKGATINGNTINANETCEKTYQIARNTPRIRLSGRRRMDTRPVQATVALWRAGRRPLTCV
jgi:hypothetical protein